MYCRFREMCFCWKDEYLSQNKRKNLFILAVFHVISRTDWRTLSSLRTANKTVRFGVKYFVFFYWILPRNEQYFYGLCWSFERFESKIDQPGCSIAPSTTTFLIFGKDEAKMTQLQHPPTSPTLTSRQKNSPHWLSLSSTAEFLTVMFRSKDKNKNYESMMMLRLNYSLGHIFGKILMAWA